MSPVAANGHDAGDGGGAVIPDAAVDGARSDDASAPDTGPSAPSCGDAGGALGEYATWSGKVNVHRTPGGVWVVDSDCSSGSNNDTVAYCKKFWPSATAQVPFPVVSSDLKPFTAGGGSAPMCGTVYPFEGLFQFVCCGAP